MSLRDHATIAFLLVGLLLPAGSISAQAPSPDSANPRVRTADSLFTAQQYGAALKAYELLAGAEPSVPSYWMRIGFSAYQLKQFERAAAAFERAAAIGRNPVALYNAAAMHASLGNADRTFFWLDSAIVSGGVTPEQIESDADFTGVRNDARYRAALTKARKQTSPCLDDPERRRFDFWLGEWEVRNAAGNAAGRSVVESVSGGCALYENWTDVRGGTGKSLNAWNPAIRQWQQYWVGQFGAVTEYRLGEWRDSSLVFLSEEIQGPQGRVMQRLSFTPLANGVVRQSGERSTDGGKTWVPGFELFYHRVRK